MGVHWNTKHDSIIYTFNDIDKSKRVTKPEILSQIAKLFDRLGLLRPIIATAKFIMQTLWQLIIEWHETEPPTIYVAWGNYRNELPLLQEVNIDRKVIIKNHVNIQLHYFSDANEKAYGACTYIRSVNKENRVITQLLCPKSCVAPLGWAVK